MVGGWRGGWQGGWGTKPVGWQQEMEGGQLLAVCKLPATNAVCLHLSSGVWPSAVGSKRQYNRSVKAVHGSTCGSTLTTATHRGHRLADAAQRGGGGEDCGVHAQHLPLAQLTPPLTCMHARIDVRQAAENVLNEHTRVPCMCGQGVGTQRLGGAPGRGAAGDCKVTCTVAGLPTRHGPGHERWGVGRSTVRSIFIARSCRVPCEHLKSTTVASLHHPRDFKWLQVAPAHTPFWSVVCSSASVLTWEVVSSIADAVMDACGWYSSTAGSTRGACSTGSTLQYRYSWESACRGPGASRGAA